METPKVRTSGKKDRLISFQNLMITCLEFFCIKSKNLKKLTTLKDDHGILEILKANRESSFLQLTKPIGKFLLLLLLKKLRELPSDVR